MSRTATIQRKTAETDIRLEVDLDGSGRGDRHGRRFLRPHAHAPGQTCRHRPDDRGQGRLARRSAPHGRGRWHLPGQAVRQALGDGPASAATATSRCPWTRRWPPVRSISAGGPISSSRPSSPRPRSASSTASWSPTSGTPLPQTSWATYTFSSPTAATAITLPKPSSSPPPAPSAPPGARPADHGRAQHKGVL